MTTPVPESRRLRDAVAQRIAQDDELLAGTVGRGALRGAVARALAAEGVVAAPDVWARMVRDLVDELGGLGPIESLLRDPDVTDVLINAADEIHVERGGRLERTNVRFDDDAHVLTVVTRAIGPLGLRLDRAHPFVDAVLDGGVRLHAVLPPLAPRPVVTFRRVAPVVPSWDELAARGMVTPAITTQLRDAVERRQNVVLAGRAGVGKTTLLARLVADIGNDRVIVIEDAPELRPSGTHAVHLRTRPPSPDGVGGVTTEQLVRNALRMRPDRLVVGEVRGGEVADLLQAMNTGHDGSMTTVHANGAEEALVRLEGMALLAGIPRVAVQAQLAAAVDLIVALDRDPGDGRRVVAELARVVSGPSGLRTEALAP
ncbi:MAG: ATPase, T2SS/T4P/T4SS family [Nitriliruptoraceae bacterium]